MYTTGSPGSIFQAHASACWDAVPFSLGTYQLHDIRMMYQVLTDMFFHTPYNYWLLSKSCVSTMRVCYMILFVVICVVFAVRSQRIHPIGVCRLSVGHRLSYLPKAGTVRHTTRNNKENPVHVVCTYVYNM